MELRHLRYFVAVADELSFTRAAQRLGIAQPPLSQQIARLERELGVQLLERSSRSVGLTQAGRALLDEARTLLARSEETRRIVSRVSAGESGALRVASVASGFSGPLVESLRVFRTTYPDVLPLVYEMEATPQLEALEHRTVDIAFLRSPGPYSGLDMWPLADETLVAAVPERHPALTSSPTTPLPLSALASERFVLFPRASAPDAFDTIVGACRTAGFTPDVVYEAPNDHVLVSLVAAGLGVSLVPHSTSNLNVPGAHYRPVTPACQAATLAVALPRVSPAEPALHLLEIARRLAGRPIFTAAGYRRQAEPE
ncbi:MAG: LysR family transcriptional regulator [Nocardioidaceae bacterium]|nr:LysR family transcriptional regulator [Nocardioidaceae bacterium]